MVRPWGRIENSLRAIKVIFVAFDKRLDMPGIQQLDVVAQLDQPPRPAVGAAAGLYTDQLGQLAKKPNSSWCLNIFLKALPSD
jgi:hypothetical protein